MESAFLFFDKRLKIKNLMYQSAYLFTFLKKTAYPPHAHFSLRFFCPVVLNSGAEFFSVAICRKTPTHMAMAGKQKIPPTHICIGGTSLPE